jgi:biopolymer transport protein ExbB
MRCPATLPILILTLTLLGGSVQTTSQAQDVREAARQAAADREAARQRAAEVEQRILADRQQLRSEVERLEAEQQGRERSIASLESRIDAGQQRLEDLERRWSERELEFREVSGNVRLVARDLETMLHQSPLTAAEPERLDRVSPLLRKGYFPDLDDIASMADVLLQEIRLSGQVSLHEGTFVGRDGQDRRARILSLGKFASIYRDGDEVGFLTYSPEGRRLYALSRLPSRGTRRQISRYLDGKAEVVPIDLSGGAALRQVIQQVSLADQLRSGGPIIWPILAIALGALLIVIYKIWFLQRVHGNTDRIMGQVNERVAAGDWEGGDRIIREHEKKQWPVVHVIRAGLAGRGKDRETLESILQEAILHELPRLERGLSVLAVFGAVAPLLGLLGTVTGMIDTFRVITLYGTGDPKLMSGGISEALVTTELGLAVAIPIMLLHTFLSRRVNHIVGEMEEKAVHLTNLMQTETRRDGDSQASD